MERQRGSRLRFAIGEGRRSLRGLRFAAAALAAAAFAAAVTLRLGGVVAIARVFVVIALPAAGAFAALCAEWRRDLESRRLECDAAGLWFCARGRPRSPIVLFSQPLGIALFSNRGRDRLVLGLTTRERTGYVAAHLGKTPDVTMSSLLQRAHALADDDPALDAIGPDGKPLRLTSSGLAELLVRLRGRSEAPFERCFLSDTSGAPVVLDGKELRLGRKIFDLGSPLEWHPLQFQEPLGRMTGGNDWEAHAPPIGGVAVYQGTWVRQGACEAVMVSLSVATPSNATAPAPPPPRDLRVGIERAYMARFQSALAQAPHATSRPGRAAGPALRSS